MRDDQAIVELANFLQLPRIKRRNFVAQLSPAELVSMRIHSI
jgi:hypothetical protein